METAAPDRLGPYRIVGSIGEGGMGVVFRGQHLDTGELVALKTARSPHASQISGLRCEIHALARIRHPGIVQIIAEGQEQGLPWYAMELLDGRTLESYLRSIWMAPTPVRASATPSMVLAVTLATPLPGHAVTRDSLAPSAPPALLSDKANDEAPTGPKKQAAGGKLQEVLRVFKRLCGPLAFLHARGIVHRDLKPANVFLRSDGTPVLMDFGLVIRGESSSGRERIEVAGDVTGTAAYMSPEQAMGQLGDPRTDLYSLGCMLYEAVTGRVPFRGATLQKVMWMHLDIEPEPPSGEVEGVPVPLDELIRRMLAKNPQDRLGHADDVATVLEGLLDDEGTTPEPTRRGGYLYRPRMVGRDDLMTRLLENIELLLHGHGSMVLLGGESGVGKTTVASAAAHSARVARIAVVTGECVQLASGHEGDATQGAPLHPFKGFFDYVADRCHEQGVELTEKWLGARGRVLAPYAPRLASLPGQERHAEPPEIPAQAARARLVEALRDTLAAVASERGLLLVLDDLQWADDLTLSTLAELDKRWLADRSLFVLGTYRSEEMNEGLREVMKAPGCANLDVGRLDHTTVGSIIADMLAMRRPPQPLVDLLATRSDGNPFFVAEYLRTAVAEGLLFRAYGTWTVAGRGEEAGRFESLDVPASLRDLVGRRLGGLSHGARGLAEAASVLGRRLNGDAAVRIARATQDDALDALKELLTKQVLVEVGTGSFQFIHDKLREITYDRIDGARRRELHRLAAEQMEAAGSTAFYELAVHFVEAGEPADLGKAMRYFELAGDQARKSFANRDAVRIYGDLLALAKRAARPVPQLSLARWHRMSADAYMGLGKTVDAQAHLLEAVKLLGHPMPEGKAKLSLGLVGQVLTQLVHRLRPIPSSDEVNTDDREQLLEAARAYDLLMPVSFYLTGDIRRILYATLANVNLAERAGPSQELALAYGNMHLTTGLVPLPGVADAYWRRTQEVLDCVSDPSVRCWICILASVYAIGIADWPKALQLAEEALEIARRVGFHRRTEEALGLIANVHTLRGDFAEALTWSHSTRQSSLRGDPQTLLWGYAGESQSHSHLGQVAEALELADRAQALLGEVTSRPERIMAFGAVAQSRVASGDLAGARAAATEALKEMAKTAPTSFYCITAYSSVAEAFVRSWEVGAHDDELERMLVRSLAEMKRSARVFAVHIPREFLNRARKAAADGNVIRARHLARRARETAEHTQLHYDVGLADKLLMSLGDA